MSQKNQPAAHTKKTEPCMHCGQKIIPLVRGIGDRAICTSCGIDRLGFLVFAIRAGCQAGDRVLKNGGGHDNKG